MVGPDRGYKRWRRISTRADIQRLLGSGNRLRRGDVELYWRQGDSAGRVRGGVIIGARWRADKPARNRIRRRYREALRVLLPSLSAGVDVLLRLRNPGGSAAGRSGKRSGEAAGSTLQALLADAGLIVEAEDGTRK